MASQSSSFEEPIENQPSSSDNQMKNQIRNALIKNKQRKRKWHLTSCHLKQGFWLKDFCLHLNKKSIWGELITELKILALYSDIKLSGDGRSDSPGHGPQFRTNVLMEQFSN